MTTCGEALVALLEVYGVDTVFGIPGIHTMELYRGLAHSNLRHITPRHEQGAGQVHTQLVLQLVRLGFLGEDLLGDLAHGVLFAGDQVGEERLEELCRLVAHRHVLLQLLEGRHASEEAGHDGHRSSGPLG